MQETLCLTLLGNKEKTYKKLKVILELSSKFKRKSKVSQFILNVKLLLFRSSKGGGVDFKNSFIKM
jgi:hypothetical protein